MSKILLQFFKQLYAIYFNGEYEIINDILFMFKKRQTKSGTKILKNSENV